VEKGYSEHFKKLKNTSNQKKPDKPKAGLVVKKSPPKAKFPWVATVVLSGLLLGAGWGYHNLELIEKYLDGVEVSFFGSAQAQAGSATTQGPGEAKNSEATHSPAPSQCPPAEKQIAEEMSYFNSLSERKKQLDLREAELNALEEELHKQRQEVEGRIGKLEQIRAEIATVLKEKVDVDETRVTTLVDFYSNMKPKQAAEIFNNLNEDLAVEVLGRMKKKNAAEIMNLLEPQKARTLSEKFTGYKRR
jgi:flagellar motility protein MotE (MotC chaperone)